MLDFEADAATLHPLVPAGTELDSRERITCVSVVGFHFTSTRVLGMRVPGHTAFDEVKLRFSVRRREAGAWRRGVVFIRELAPRRVIAWMPRWCYNEPYQALPMRHRVEHQPWRVWHADGATVDADIASLYGPAIADPLRAPPRSAFLADGSPVVAYRPRRLDT